MGGWISPQKSSHFVAQLACSRQARFQLKLKLQVEPESGKNGKNNTKSKLVFCLKGGFIVPVLNVDSFKLVRAPEKCRRESITVQTLIKKC